MPGAREGEGGGAKEEEEEGERLASEGVSGVRVESLHCWRRSKTT
jgi:hypothetical protein